MNIKKKNSVTTVVQGNRLVVEALVFGMDVLILYVLLKFLFLLSCYVGILVPES